MSFQKKFLLSLETDERRFNFFGIIHRTERSDELLLNPENFYKKLEGKIPEGIHYEIQWEALPLMCKDLKKGLIHIHEENEKNFVCWTKQVSTEEESLDVIKVAALGIFYGAHTGKDFANVFADCKNSMEETIKKLIELCELKHEPSLMFNEDSIEGRLRHNILAEKIFFL